LNPTEGISGQEGGNTIKLEHYVYGSHQGYRLKAWSKGADAENNIEPFKGMMLPIKQSDVKHMTEIRAILPCGWDIILLSRIILGGVDDHARGTIANHVAIIPRKALEEGSLTYQIVDDAMKEFEEKNPDPLDVIPPLDIPDGKHKTDYSELKNLLPRKVVDNLMSHYEKDKDCKVFIKYLRSNQEQRIKAAYLISMLMDVKMKVNPMFIFTDVPHSGAKKIFNLVMARVMIDIKPGGDWVLITASQNAHGTGDVKKKRKLKKTLDDIYG